MANIKSIGGNPIVVPSSGIESKAIGYTKLGNGAVNSEQTGCVNFEPGWIPVGSGYNTVDVTNPTINDTGGNTWHAIVECEYGDVFEISLFGGHTARAFAYVAGPDYSTPYAVLTRESQDFDDALHETYLVITNPDVKYVVFNNKFAATAHPSGYARKLTMSEYRTVCYGMDYEFLVRYPFLISYYLKSDGTGESNHADNRLTPWIPVRKNDVLEYALSVNHSSYLGAFYDADFAKVELFQAGNDYGNTLTYSYVVPSDGWVRLNYYYSNNNPDSNTMRSLNSERYVRLTPSAHNISDDLYGLSYEAMEYLRASRNPQATSAPVTTLLHFSDIHGDSGRIRAIAGMLKAPTFGDYVDDAICTGDLVYQNSTNANPFDSVANTAGIMLVMGNHDVKTSSGTLYKYTSGFTIQNAYTKYFSSVISGWSVTTPDIDYPTYYYKDYASTGIRLIVLDGNMDGTNVATEYAAQLQWLADVLADAKTNSMHVVCSQHFPVQGTPDLIACNFTDLRSIAYTEMGDTSYNQSTIEAFQQKVQDFIDDGGDFVCWLVGHNHADFVYTVEEYPDQLCIIVGISSTRVTSSLADRQHGKAKNLFNTVTFSPTEHHVRLVRFGADKTKFMVSKKAVCIDYQTKQIIAQA